MVILYEGGLKKLTTTRYPVYPVMSYSVSCTGYVVGYVVFSFLLLLLEGPHYLNSQRAMLLIILVQWSYPSTQVSL
jgi:hypothetical protein